MRRFSGRVLGAVLFAALYASPVVMAADPPPARLSVGRLGAQELTVADMRASLDLLDAQERALLLRDPQALERAVRTELIRRAVLAEALRRGWDQRPEVAARLVRAREQVLVATFMNDLARPAAAYPADAEIAAAYEKNRAAFVRPAQFRLAQIYLASPPEGAAAAQAAASAAKLAAEAQRNPDGFAKLAETQSQHAASAARGGDMGWIAEADLLPALRDTVRGLKAGAVSGPVRSDSGWHIVRLLEVQPGGPATLADAREAIAASLRMSQAQANEARYLDELLAKQPIALNEAGMKALRDALR